MAQKKKKQANLYQKQKVNKRDARLISDCTRKYIACLADPMSPDAQGACIPDGQGGRTFKFTQQARVSIQSTQPDHDLVINIAPGGLVNNSSVTFCSDKGLGSTTFDSMRLSGSVHAVGSPFSAVAHGEMELRCVGWGVEVYNTSPRLNTAGTMYGYLTNSGGSFNANTTPLAQSLNVNSRRTTMSRALDKPLKMAWTNDDFTQVAEFRPSGDVLGISGNYAGGMKHAQCFVCVPAQGNSGTGSHASVEVRLVAHFEARGKTAAPMGNANLVPEPALSQKLFNGFSSIVRDAMSALPPKERIVGYLTKMAYQHYAGGPRAIAYDVD